MKKLMTEWRKYTQKINEGHGELSMVGSTTLPFSQNDENEDRQDRDLDAAIELMNSGEGDVDRGGKPYEEWLDEEYEYGDKTDLGKVKVQTHDNLPSWAIENIKNISKGEVNVELLTSEDEEGEGWPAYVLVLGDDGVPVISYHIENIPRGENVPWADIESWDKAVELAWHTVESDSSN